MRRIRKWLVVMLAVIVIVPTVAYQLGTAMNANEIENIEVEGTEETVKPGETTEAGDDSGVKLEGEEDENIIVLDGEIEPEEVAPGDSFEGDSIFSLADLIEDEGTDRDKEPLISINPDDKDYVSVIVDYPIDVVYNGEDQTWEPDVYEVGEFHAWEGESDNNPGDTCRRLVKGTEYIVQYLDSEGLPKSDRTNPTGPIIVKIIGQGTYHGEVTRTYQILPAEDAETIIDKVDQIASGGSKPADGEKPAKKRSGLLGTVIEEVEKIFHNDDQVALGNTELGNDDSGSSDYSEATKQMKKIVVFIAVVIVAGLAIIGLRRKNR